MRDALALALCGLSLAALIAYPGAPAPAPVEPATYALIGPTPGVAGSLDVLDYDLSFGDCVDAMRMVRGSACEIER